MNSFPTRIFLSSFFRSFIKRLRRIVCVTLPLLVFWQISSLSLTGLNEAPAAKHSEVDCREASESLHHGRCDAAVSCHRHLHQRQHQGSDQDGHADIEHHNGCDDQQRKRHTRTGHVCCPGNHYCHCGIWHNQRHHEAHHHRARRNPDLARRHANSTLDQHGRAQQFTATGTYSDGSTQDLSNTATWSSSALSVATVSITGLATTVGSGQTTIQPTQGSISGSSNLTVTKFTHVYVMFPPPSGVNNAHFMNSVITQAAIEGVTVPVQWADVETGTPGPGSCSPAGTDTCQQHAFGWAHTYDWTIADGQLAQWFAVQSGTKKVNLILFGMTGASTILLVRQQLLQSRHSVLREHGKLGRPHGRKPPRRAERQQRRVQQLLRGRHNIDEPRRESIGHRHLSRPWISGRRHHLGG